MLCRYLDNYGTTQHIHSRKPPNYLTHGDSDELFGNRRMSDAEIAITKVIYIYKDPIKATISRFKNPNHQRNTQSPIISLDKVIESKKDKYKLEEFYDNYVYAENNLNYDIICVKYEDLWNNWSEFNKIIEIPDDPIKYPNRKETNRKIINETNENLSKAYESLKNKMKDMNFIFINKKKS
jgi:arginine utilization protein RocB